MGSRWPCLCSPLLLFGRLRVCVGVCVCASVCVCLHDLISPEPNYSRRKYNASLCAYTYVHACAHTSCMRSFCTRNYMYTRHTHAQMRPRALPTHLNVCEPHCPRNWRSYDNTTRPSICRWISMPTTQFPGPAMVDTERPGFAA